MATLIHLNGAPGVGKSTIAERWVAEHPGVLNCDVDRLRGFVGGWQEDFVATGAVVRPVALAMIGAHLAEGRDVVLPQMLANVDERDRFRAVALESGHAYVHIMLRATAGQAGDRFYRRPVADPIYAAVRDIVDGDGGVGAIEEWERRLANSASHDAVYVDAGKDIDCTYRSVLVAVRQSG